MSHHYNDARWRLKSQASKLRVTGLRAGNSPVTVEFPEQITSNAENVSIWWRHHDSVDGIRMRFIKCRYKHYIPRFTSNLKCCLLLHHRLKTRYLRLMWPSFVVNLSNNTIIPSHHAHHLEKTSVAAITGTISFIVQVTTPSNPVLVVL